MKSPSSNNVIIIDTYHAIIFVPLVDFTIGVNILILADFYFKVGNLLREIIVDFTI